MQFNSIHHFLLLHWMVLIYQFFSFSSNKIQLIVCSHFEHRSESVCMCNWMLFLHRDHHETNWKSQIYIWTHVRSDRGRKVFIVRCERVRETALSRASGESELFGIVHIWLKKKKNNKEINHKGTLYCCATSEGAKRTTWTNSNLFISHSFVELCYVESEMKKTHSFGHVHCAAMPTFVFWFIHTVASVSWNRLLWHFGIADAWHFHFHFHLNVTEMSLLLDFLQFGEKNTRSQPSTTKLFESTTLRDTGDQSQ